MVAPRPVETPSADALRAQQMAEQLRQAEEARRRAEEAARIAAENARRAAEAARKAAEEARDKAEKSRLAAEAAEKKAAETKLEVDEKEATRLRKQAKADELDALKKEATANLREKEHTLATSKLDDVRQRRAPNDPSEATRTAQTEVDAANKTMALYEPPVPEQPTPLDQASARTKTLFEKAQTAAKPVFAAQAAGREPSKTEVDALNQAVGNWLDAAKQDMRTAGVQAQSRGEDPNAAIDAEAKRLKQAIDDGGVFDPGKLGEYIDQNRDAVRKESPAVRQVRAEQYNVQLDGDKQVADAATGARKADADAAAARKYADSFGTPSTDSQVTAKQDAEDEAARLAEVAEQANTRLTGLQKAFGIKDPARPERNTVGTVEAGYNARVADLDAADLGARYKAAVDAGDQEAMKTLGPQLDDALARQKLARSLDAALTADLDLHDAGIESDAAEAAWKAASANQPQLRTVERTGRGGKYTQTITPDGYDKTFWLDPSKEGDRQKVQLDDDGKYYLVQSGPRGSETRTELNPITARRFAAYDKLSDSQKQATDTKGALARTNEDLLGSPDGRAPPKLDYDAWIPDAKAINDKVTQADNGVNTANWNLTQAVKSGASPQRLDELRQQLGTAMQTQQTARNNAEALKAITELRDAERKQAIGQDPGDLDKLRSNARAAVDKARQAQPLTPAQEKTLRDKTTQLGKDLEAADTKVETTRTAWEKATEPADKKAKHELYLAALDDYDKVDLQFRDGDSQLKLLDAQRAALAAPTEYEAQTFNGAFAKPQLSMFMRNGESVTADIYPQNYDPTWNLKPGKDGQVDPAGLPRGLSPDDIEVRYNQCGGGYIVTIKKDSEVVGYQKSERYGDLRYFTVKEGTYTMHPQTARLWDATNTDPGMGGSALTRAQDYRAQVQKDLQAYAADHPQAAPLSSQGSQPITGADGKPVPTLNLGDDLGARKPAVDKAVTDATEKLDSLLLARSHVTGDTGSLDLQITEARAQKEIAQLEQRAVNSVLAWQTANQNRQIFEADQRAGRTAQASYVKPPQENADDLRDTALKDRTAWLQRRDKHGLELAQGKVTLAEQAHADWKRDHPYLLGSEKNAQTWKNLTEARGNADMAQRQLVSTANQRATIDQQQLISSTLSPSEHDDPQKLYELFMDNPQVMAQSVVNAHYVQYGSQPMEMAGRTHLGNEVSFALGWQPSVELDPNSPAGNLQLRRTQNLFELSGDQKKLHDSVVDKIVELGGERARVTVLPVVYAVEGENGGIVKTALFKVERDDGSAKFVDEQGREYTDVDDYRGNNTLPIEGVNLAMPEDGSFKLDADGNVKLFTGDARTETGWQTFRRTAHVDAIVGGVGFVAGVVLTVGSLGTLSVPGAVLMGASITLMAAGGYGVVTSIDGLHNQASHGVSINPFTNEQARMEWMNLGLSAASIPVAGASGRAMQLALRAKQASTLAEGATGAARAKHLADAALLTERAAAWGAPAQAMAKPLAVTGAVALGDGGRALIKNWDHMTPAQRSEQLGMLGMGAAGFASPVFARGYVNVHNNVKTTVSNARGVEPMPAAATTRGQTGPAPADARLAEPLGVYRLNDGTTVVHLADGSVVPLGERAPGAAPVPPADGSVPVAGGRPTAPAADQPPPASRVPADVPRFVPAQRPPSALPLTDFTVRQATARSTGDAAGGRGGVWGGDTGASGPRPSRNSASEPVHSTPHRDLHNPYRKSVFVDLTRSAPGIDPMGMTRRSQQTGFVRFADLPEGVVRPPGEARTLSTVRGGTRPGEAAPPPRNAPLGPDGLPWRRYDTTMTAIGDRHIARFHVWGGVERGALAMNEAQTMAILTGFNVGQVKGSDGVPRGLPETDGPVGAVEAGRAARLLGKDVVYVTHDQANARLLRATLDAYGEPQGARIVIFDAEHGPSARTDATALLREFGIDTVFAIELPGRTASGDYLNMRGESIKGFNRPLDEIVLAANDMHGVRTIAVGDGGNEAGMGPLRADIPRALNGEEMASAVPADHVVTAWNSNLGGKALALEMLRLNDRLDLLPTMGQRENAIHAMLRAGAVDGVTRGSTAGEAHGINRTGVDGFEPRVHEVMDVLMEAQARKPAGLVDNRIQLQGRPTIVGAFDSSNGGLIAAKNMARYLQRESGDAARFVVVVDHKRAPYGSITDTQELAQVVNYGLRAAEGAGVHVIAMACNTACTPGKAIYGRDIEVPVVDLIDVTVGQVLARGGERPAIIATPKTTDVQAYPRAVADRKAPDQTVDAIGISGKEWATIVNELRHLSRDPEVQAGVMREVKAVTDNVPDDATSVWLCCTHYPGLEGHIRSALNARGLDIPIIDPMKHQALAVMHELGLQPRPVKAPLPDAADGPAPVVISSDALGGNVPTSTRALVGREDAVVFNMGEYQRLDPGVMNIVREALSANGTVYDPVLVAFNARSIAHLHDNGRIEAAAIGLQPSKKVLLLTGFNVDEVKGVGIPETDGPPGTVALGRALRLAGKEVVYGTHDAANKRVLEATLAAMGERDARVIVFDPTSGGSADRAANILLTREGVDAVVAVELPGRSAQGNYSNMRGADISPFNRPLDAIVLAANDRDILTAGIYDGGNESGAGNVQGRVPLALDGETVMASAVPVDYPVAAWNSNLGAETLAIEVLRMHGKLDQVHTASNLVAAIHASLRTGAVDGVTRGGTADVAIDGFVTGVDGMSPRVHAVMHDLQVRNAQRRNDMPGPPPAAPRGGPEQPSGAPTARSVPVAADEPVPSAQPLLALPRADSAAEAPWHLPRAQLGDAVVQRVLRDVHRAGGNLDGARYVAVPAQRAGIAPDAPLQHFATLDEALAAAPADAAGSQARVMVMDEAAVAAPGRVADADLIGTVGARWRDGRWTIESFDYNPGHAGTPRVATPAGWRPGAPLIRNEGGARIDVLNARPGSPELQINQFPRRLPDLQLFGEGYGLRVNGQLVPEAMPVPDGYFAVSADGLTGTLRGPDGRLLSGAQVARLIAEHPSYQPGQPVIFYSCLSGDGVVALAQEVASALHVDTYAGARPMRVDSHGVSDGTVAYASRISFDADPGHSDGPQVQQADAFHRFRPGLPIQQVKEAGRVVYEAPAGLHGDRPRVPPPAHVDVDASLLPANWVPASAEAGASHTSLRMADPAAAGGTPEAFTLPGAQWPQLLEAIASRRLSADGALYVYRFQNGGNPDRAAPQDWAAPSGQLKGWVHVPEGSSKPRWLGQSMPGHAPGMRADASRKLGGLGDGPLGPQDYLVVSRMPPDEVLAAQGLRGVPWADADVSPLVLPARARPAVPQVPAVVAQPEGGVVSAEAAAAAAPPAAPAATGNRRLAALYGLSTLGAFGTGGASGLMSQNLHLALTDPALTGPLSFIYRGSVAAGRTRLSQRITHHVEQVGAGGNADKHLAWLERTLVRRGGLIGIAQADRAHFARAIETLRGDAGDTTAQGVLAAASGKLLSPQTVAGRVNDGLQLGTLALNNGNTAMWFAQNGFDPGNPATWSNLLFVGANVVLSARNFAGRLGYMAHVQDLASRAAMKGSQIWVMGGYTAAAAPWAMADAMATPGPLGATKAGLDLVFGYGAARQGINDVRGATGRAPLSSRVAPLVILGSAAVARFGLELLMPNDDKKQQPLLDVTPTPVPTPAPAPTSAPTPGSTAAPAEPKKPVDPEPAQPPQAAPEMVTVDGSRAQARTLWGIAETNVAALLTPAQQQAAAVRGGDAALTLEALKRLTQINPEYRLRLDLMDGRVTDQPGDPDTLIDGWQFNVSGANA